LSSFSAKILTALAHTYRGQPPDYLLKEAKKAVRFFKHAGSYPGSEAPNGLASAYRFLSEEEVEAVNFFWLPK
jgi:dual specificity protein kinase YAK1